ncbi:MAG TPA: rod shape-determining protein MreC [Candidatus Aquilonibacter sp.]|nr:rod shape-determining protein MreC [Candidatus Aquilonibacter sp.]
MESLLGRHRNLIIFLSVLFLQALGLAVQVKRGGPDEQDTRLIRIWAVDALTPFERAVVRVQNSADGVWRNYFFLRGVRAENRQLKEQIEQMRLEEVRLGEDAAQARRLQSLLAFKEQVIAKTVAAQVIGSSASDLSKSIYIDKGSNDGIAQDMPVITATGIVGKVLRVYPSTALVLLINDQTSGVGALLEKSRLQGVVHGTPNGELMLERVMSDEQVAPGETVLSSGGDQIFPKGLPVGTVTHVSPGKELFLNIKVKPAADLSRLEEVLVVTEKHEQQSLAENAGRMRAADILALRLPSVPDKPAAAGQTATGAKSSGAAQAKPQVATGKIKPPQENASPTTGAQPSKMAKVATPVAAQSVAGKTQSAKANVANSTEHTAVPTDLGKKNRTTGINGSILETHPSKPEATQAKPLNAQPASPPVPSPSQDTPH